MARAPIENKTKVDKFLQTIILTSYTKRHDEDYLGIPDTGSKAGRISLPNSSN